VLRGRRNIFGGEHAGAALSRRCCPEAVDVTPELHFHAKASLLVSRLGMAEADEASECSTERESRDHDCESDDERGRSPGDGLSASTARCRPVEDRFPVA
jgi:hypothetical protein